MLYLRQSTASQSVLIGPFVDTDGAAVTGLTIDAADIRLSKNGANIVGKNSGGGTHDELGMYAITLDATDTDTVGRLQLTVAETGALIVYHEFQVLEEAIFDGLFADSAARIPADVTAISGDTTAADNLETAFDDTAGAVPWQGIIDQGTAQSATGTTLVLRSAAAFADDELIGATIVITGGSAGVGQRRLITDYVSSTDTATVDTWTTTPTGTITYKIYATAPSSGGGGLDAAGIRAALGMSSADLDSQLDAIVADTNELQTDWANGGRLDLILDARASQTTADAIETDTQNIQSRIPASLNNGCIAADVQRINDVEVVGAGTEGDKWRA